MAEDGSCVNKDFYKKKSDCWFLDDGRKVCLLATDVKIEGGEVVEVDNKIKDKSNNGVSHEKQKSTNQESNENETGGLSLN